MKRTISKSERPYKLLLCVMISLLVIMLAGCSTSSDSDTNTRGFTDFATIEEEYLSIIPFVCTGYPFFSGLGIIKRSDINVNRNKTVRQFGGNDAIHT